ncbi:MAG: sigma-70 family RNA polymerase sigma factor [Candidatus Marinimicrobia bacterium]|nr:sigma-70 family RNA polymerase sigma factor [Candidatus Neomarinimicrobiota bacterium]MDP6852569.1 sigma-70 family RNA polymerase sigma factor [Candidatus Neomarinimicrobiota bacterium]
MEDDTTLIHGFLNGDIHCFNELIRKHESWVHVMVNQIVKHREDSEDIAQDVFVKVYFSLKKFRFESEFKTWLYRIVINRINNYFRKQKLLSWFGYELYEDITPEASESNNESDKLFSLASQLPATQRNIVLLRIYQDLPFKAIGKILSISENSAKVSFHKAKQNLRQYWEQSNEQEI